MKTLRLIPWLSTVTITVTFIALSACQKKCQPPPSEPPKTITANPWRLISTTNPNVKNNNRYTFIIMEFTQDYSGQVRKVVNNREFETPISTIRYNLITDSGRGGSIRIQYSSVAQPSADGTENPAEASGEVGDTTDYSYSLHNTLTLTEVKKGYTYEFVPFVGIVDPDSNCSF